MLKLKSAFISILSLVVIASSFSFTIERHFCSGKHVDSAIFTEASCEVHQTNCNNCHKAEKPKNGCQQYDHDKKKSNSGCCEREITSVIGNDYQITIPEIINIKKVEQIQDDFFAYSPVIGQNLNQLKFGGYAKIFHYLRPNLRIDKYVLFESYLL